MVFSSCQFRTVQVYIEDLRPAVAAGRCVVDKMCAKLRLL